MMIAHACNVTHRLPHEYGVHEALLSVRASESGRCVLRVVRDACCVLCVMRVASMVTVKKYSALVGAQRSGGACMVGACLRRAETFEAEGYAREEIIYI